MKKNITLVILLLVFFSFTNKLKAITDIKISNNNIVPSFSKNITEYNVFVSNKTEIIGITVVKEDNEIITGDGSKSLKKGLNIIEIISYENEIEKERYTLNIVRGELKNDKEDATLNKMEIKYHNIDFKSDKFTYKINASNDEEMLEITYDTQNPLAVVKMYGDINLIKKENIIKLEVTSENKKNTNTYTIKVNKKIEKETKTTKKGFFDNKNFDKFELKLIRIGIISIGVILLSILFYFIFIKKRTNKVPNI